MSKTWFVTGASRGIGLAIVRAALHAGHRVVATARRPEQIERALADAPTNLLALRLDVSDPAQMRPAVEAASARFGNIDVLVNNAGYGQLGWFEDQSEEQIAAQFQTNLFGAMNLTRAVLPQMRSARRGHIFAMSSISGLRSSAGGSIYSASKFALEGWMEGLAGEVGPFGIGVTIVEPGYFNTDFLDPSSSSFGARAIEDYAEVTAIMKMRIADRNHCQIGDPAKLAAVMLRVLELPDLPLRLAAGSDAFDEVIKRAQALRSNAEHWRDLSYSTDGAEWES